MNVYGHRVQRFVRQFDHQFRQEILLPLRRGNSARMIALLAVVGALLLGVIFFLLRLVAIISAANPVLRDVFIYASFFYKNSSSFSLQSETDTLVVLMLANRNDHFPYMRCGLNSKNTSLVPAQVSRLDYVGVCEIVLFIAWCNFPQNASNSKNKRYYDYEWGEKAYVDLGTQVLAAHYLRDAYSMQKPLLHKLLPKRADRTPRKLVMCISRIFAFEKWELLVAAMEVYKTLDVDLVVTHVYSTRTEIFELIHAYEAEGRLAIRRGVKLPHFGSQNFDPERELEYSGQLAMAHECFYEFRESAQFISLVDWDDLLVTTRYPKIADSLVAATLAHPNAAYFYVNKLESGILRRAAKGLDPANFHIDRLLRNAVFTKRQYNSEKMVIRPTKVHGFWIHFTDEVQESNVAVQLHTDDIMILHLSKEINQTGNGYEENLLASLDWQQLKQSSDRFFGNATVARLMRSLPTKTHYFDAIRHCSLYINAYPDLMPPPPCLSYSLCSFPRVKVPCTVAKSKFRSVPVKPTNVYTVHTLLSTKFERTEEGCF